MIFAAVERDGRMRATVVGDSRSQEQTTHAIRSTLHEFVRPGSMVLTDDWGRYNVLDRPGIYKFRHVKHSQRIYVEGDVHTKHRRRLLRSLQDRRTPNTPRDLGLAGFPAT